MILIGLLVGIPVLALIACHVAGHFLPGEHSAEVMEVIGVDIDAVWTRVRSLQEYASWRRGIKRIEIVAGSAGNERFLEIGKHGRILYQVEECEPPSAPPALGHGRVVHRIVDDTLPFVGRWIFEFSPTDSGTRIKLREEGFIKSPIFRTLGRLFFDPTTSMRRYVQDLRSALTG
jgi:hypothetical protein